MDKVSFRQVGKKVQGDIKVGTVNSAYQKQTAASIPSKFETILYADHRHTKGFGTRAHRFTQVIEDFPGPGQYNQIIHQSEESYSKKGFSNGFLSKNQRFKLFQYNTVAPGPGTYSVDSQASTATNRQQSAPSSMFIKPTTTPLSTKQIFPGPGQYNPASHIQEKRSITAAFKSTASRMMSVDKQIVSNPAP